MPFPLTLYPNRATASATLATANPLYSNPPITAASTGQTQLVGTSTGFGEFWAQGSAFAWAAGALDLSIAPTGHGWFLDGSLLDQMFIPDGLWVAQARGATNANTATVDLYYRFFVYDPVAQVYTLVGILSKLGNNYTTAATNFAFASQEVPPAYFKPGQRAYVDLWGNITASTMVAGNTLSVVQSNLPGFGNANIFLQTPGFVPWDKPRYASRALGATIGPDSVSQPLPYSGRGMSATVVYENRLFVPRAFGGVTIPDDPARIWVPRAPGGTVSIPTGGSVGCTLSGVGALTASLSANLTLPATTFAGVGTLSGPLSANTALTDTLSGVGTAAGTVSLATLLAVTFPGVGTLSAQLSAQTALASTAAGVGTLTGTLSANTALSTTLVGVGTLTGVLSGGGALSGTLIGVGTLAGTATFSTALAVTGTGTGALSATLSARTALACTLAGVGQMTGTATLATVLTSTMMGAGTLAGALTMQTQLAVALAGVGQMTGALARRTALTSVLLGAGQLSGAITIGGTLSLTCAGIGALMVALSYPGPSATATWVTRDLRATWVTRDETGTWTARDDKTTWKTRR